jgi:hypothetical protein
MKRVNESDNIGKLRVLVQELEKTESHTDDYKNTLHEIESLIKEELKLISKLKRPDNKLKHYETMCSGILTMISGIKL